MIYCTSVLNIMWDILVPFNVNDNLFEKLFYRLLQNASFKIFNTI